MHLRQAGCEPITMAKPIKIGFVSFLSKAADNIFSRFPSFLSRTRPVLSFVGWVPPLSHDQLAFPLLPLANHTTHSCLNKSSSTFV